MSERAETRLIVKGVRLEYIFLIALGGLFIAFTDDQTLLSRGKCPRKMILGKDHKG